MTFCSKIFVSLLLALSLTSLAHAKDPFPHGPDPTVTPGALCQHPDSYRYPEHIPYCSRAVDGDVKNQIIKTYDQKFSYRIESMPRTDFKIDHLIPLCAGGANEVSNLWPQHKSIYAITDPLEPLICQKMQDGKLKQADAVKLVKQGKNNLSQVPSIIAHLNSL